MISTMTLATGPALGFAVATAVVVAFQAALALGAPWGAWTMGGTVQGRLPPVMRVATFVQALLLVALTAIVLSAAEEAVPGLVSTMPWIAWLPVAFSAVAVILNAATRSLVERRLWLPVAMVMLATSLGVALVA